MLDERRLGECGRLGAGDTCTLHYKLGGLHRDNDIND